MIFQNRAEAGQKLAAKLTSLQNAKNLIVLAIPRGGVVIGQKLAEKLGCPLDVIITKKIGIPADPEVAMGAVGAIGQPVIDEELAARVGADEAYVKKQIARVRQEVARREKKFRGNRPALNLKDRTVILTDDGVATGATMAAAVEVVRQQDPKKIIIAVPVVSRSSLAKISQADQVIYLDAPELFFAVGQFYRQFPQLSDETVIKALKP